MAQHRLITALGVGVGLSLAILIGATLTLVPGALLEIHTQDFNDSSFRSIYPIEGTPAPGSEGTTGNSVFAPFAQSAISGPLRISPQNPRYFEDATGHEVYLTGSHTWSTLQDSGVPIQAFDFTAFLDFLVAHGHNFIRLYSWEHSKYGAWTQEDIEITPSYYQRNGPGTALDGKPKYDVTKWNEAYFTRLRDRALAAQARGIYVSVMLFDGFSLDDKNEGGATGKNPWPSHPFNAANNINGINGDLNGDGEGKEVHTLTNSAVTELQKAYVRKVIDTVNDLDNVLYEISNESHAGATDWEYEMIRYIKQYEASKAKQHPVGMTSEWPFGSNAELFASPADWISPNDSGGYKDDPPASTGEKVIIADTDHLWGIGGDRVWAWKSFTRGINPIFMDPYNCAPWWPPVPCTSSTWESLRLNMGYTRAYAERLNLATATPRQDLCSTSFCLAYPSTTAAQYLVYQPGTGPFTVDLSGSPGVLQIEWFNPANGVKTLAGTTNGGAVKSFLPPFSGDAVLLLYQSATGTPTNTPTPISTPTSTPTATPTPVSLSCVIYRSAEVPKPLPNGRTTITSSITVPSGVTIADVNATVYLTHTWMGDIKMWLTHQPSGKSVALVDRPGYPTTPFGCGGDDFNATLDDAAKTKAENRCALTTPTIYGGVDPYWLLSRFNGLNSAGKWVLTVTDVDPKTDWGVLRSWRIRICSSAVLALSEDGGDEAFVPDTPLLPATEPMLGTKPGRTDTVAPTLFLPELGR